MRKIAVTLALAGAMGMVAACGGAADESGSAPATTPETPVETAVNEAAEAATNAAAAAAEVASEAMTTLEFKIDGMT